MYRQLLLQGMHSLDRSSLTSLTFISQNIIWVFALFWYQIYANFDCSYAFDYSYILLYNLAFTSLPIIFQGILDQDVDDKVSLAVPQLYRRGIEQLEWTQTKFWTYMIDGLYQSVICFYFTYLQFRVANFETESGRNVGDYKRLGVYIANPTVLVVNVYIIMNTYRWDWFMSLITAISILLIWFWTGVYTAFTAGFTFYEAAPEVYGALSFWAVALLTIIVCLLPRFCAKAFQKMYMPYDIDVIREQVRMGKFDYLKEVDPTNVLPQAEKLAESTTSSETSNGKPHDHKPDRPTIEEDMRPIYPPSVAGTAATHNARSNNGSDGTDYTGHRSSLDRAFPHTQNTNRQSVADPYGFDSNPTRPTMEPPRPSFDRLRSSMDRTRPSFEASRDFTSAAYLSRVESSHSGANTPTVEQKSSRRREDISEDLRR